jgi:hypothetical protein
LFILEDVSIFQNPHPGPVEFASQGIPAELKPKDLEAEAFGRGEDETEQAIDRNLPAGVTRRFVKNDPSTG